MKTSEHPSSQSGGYYVVTVLGCRGNSGLAATHAVTTWSAEAGREMGGTSGQGKAEHGQNIQTDE